MTLYGGWRFSSGRDTAIGRSLELAEQSGVYPNAILIWKELKMIIDKESLRIEDERIYLRPIDVEDITNGYISGLNDPEVNRYLVNVRKNIQTRESDRARLRNRFFSLHGFDWRMSV
jgi:RimJ/RimL family protein N-acetyltransferase